MKEHLQKIRTEYPDLNPTETYEQLCEAIKPNVVEEKVDYETFMNALDQYEERLDEQIAKFRPHEKPESAEDLLEGQFEEWFEDMKLDHQDLDDMFREVCDLANALPDKSKIARIMDEMIQGYCPEFHKEYLEHQQWLKANQERLDRQEQKSLQDESDQIQNKDARTR